MQTSTIALPTNHPYLPNKYTNWYYQLIHNARTRNITTNYTERHHIIPRCFFDRGKNTFNANHPSNLVDLTPREHFLCHWLLTKMVVGHKRYQMLAALAAFTKNNQHQFRILSAGQYQKAREANYQASYGNKMYNNGKIQRRFKEPPGGNWVLGQLESTSNAHKGKKMYHNGQIAIRATSSPGPEWVQGSLNGTTGMKWWYKDNQTMMSKISPGDGWNQGLPRVRVLKRGSKWWNNGTEEVQSQISPGPEWVLGMMDSTSGCQWYNNGIRNMMSKTHPGEGWDRGMLPKRRKV